MSLTAIAALLQSALLLLSAAQSAPNLPQSFRDNAIIVAQEAITEATTAISSSTPSTGFSTTTSNQYFTTPSGAVIDGSGNIVGGTIRAPGPTIDPNQVLQDQSLSEQQVIKQQCQDEIQTMDNDYNTEVAPIQAEIIGWEQAADNPMGSNAEFSSMAASAQSEISSLSAQHTAAVNAFNAQCVADETTLTPFPAPSQTETGTSTTVVSPSPSNETWTTPSGAVVNQNGSLVSGPQIQSIIPPSTSNSYNQTLQNQIASERQSIERSCRSQLQNIQNEYNAQMSNLELTQTEDMDNFQATAGEAGQGVSYSMLKERQKNDRKILSDQETAAIDNLNAQCAMEESNSGLTPPPAY